jgi:hypothetical protein
MDIQTILYLLSIVCFVLLLIFGVSYARRNNYVSKEDLQFVSTVLGIGVEILDEMNISKEKQILKLTSIVQQSLNFALDMFDAEKDIYNEACEYAYGLCEQAGIALNDSRISIIQQLIAQGLKIKVVNE